MTIILIIVGAVCLIVGYMVPMPAALAVILRVAGAVCLVVGLVLLLVSLVGGALVVNALA